MTVLRRTITAFAAACSLSLMLASLAQAACPTTNPAADITGLNEPRATLLASDAELQSAFTKARAAEGCTTPMVFPAGFDAMSAQQQMLWLFNNEREVRGLAPFKLDSTLMSQIALNHSREMATYGYTNHPSPVNQPQSVFARSSLNPALAKGALSEDIAWGNSTAESVYGYIYEDASQGWGHRLAILGNYNWIGIGALLNVPGSQASNYFTDDFANLENYTPPASADTNPPEIGPVTYANGTATVTGVKDSPKNVNDTGATPATAGITGVVFYTNNIVETGEKFNTVPATQTAAGSGIWTANITVNAGEVLHAVAVDGSGNFTDSAPPVPAVALKTGENTVALPAAPTTALTTVPAGGGEAIQEEPFGEIPTEVMAAAAGAHKRSPHIRAITPTAAALIASVDEELGHRAVKDVRVYVRGHWQTYYPGRSHNFPLYLGEGVDLQMRAKGKWLPPGGAQTLAAPTLRLHKGWNFVAAPYPVVHMTCHATRLELARSGDKLEEISVGPRPNTGIIMRPRHGKWGNDLGMVIPDGMGFWIKDAGSSTWVPNPVQYGKRTAGTR